MEASIKFIVGQEYYYRFTCDHETKSYMTVVSRTEKSIVVQERHEKETRRIKIRIWDGVEQAYAGNYSMAGIWCADKIDGAKPPVDVYEVTEPSTANTVPFRTKTAPEPVAAPATLDPLEARAMVTLGRKILTESLAIQGQHFEVSLISAILDRDHAKFLVLLREMSAGLRAV